MNKTEITIVITFKNGVEGLSQTIESIEKQKHCNYKVIIAGENIKSVQALIQIPKENYKLLECKGTPGKILNTAVEQINTQYIMFMESYDVMSHNFIKECLNALEQYRDSSFAVVKSYCINPLMTKDKIQHIFSKKYIEEYEVCDLNKTYERLTTALDSSVFRTCEIKNIKFKENLPFEYGTDTVSYTHLDVYKRHI